MRKVKTRYQKVADRIIERNPDIVFQWYFSRLMKKVPSGWLELVVVDSPSWFRVNEETTTILNKEQKV